MDALLRDFPRGAAWDADALLAESASQPAVLESVAIMACSDATNTALMMRLLSSGAVSASQWVVPDVCLWHKRRFMHMSACKFVNHNLGKVQLLHVAAYSGNLGAATALVGTYGADVNAQNEHGRSPLMCAAYRGHLDVVRLLVESGASVVATNKVNSTAAHAAAWAKHTDVVDYLVAHGASLEAKTNTGASVNDAKALRLAADMARVALAVSAVLGAAGAQPMATKPAAAVVPPPATADAPPPALEAPTAFGTPEQRWSTPTIVAPSPSTTTMQSLPPEQADDELSADDVAALLTATSSPAPWNVNALLDSLPWTAPLVEAAVLIGASTPGGLPLCDALLDKTGLDVNALIQPAVCLWHLPHRVDDRWCEFPTHTLGSVSALHVACFAGCSDAVVALLERGADVNQQNELGRTPLSCAAFKGRLSVVKVLCEAGADVNLANASGATPAHSAAWAGHEDVVTYLLAHGGDLTMATDTGLSVAQASSQRRAARRRTRMKVTAVAAFVGKREAKGEAKEDVPREEEAQEVLTVGMRVSEVEAFVEAVSGDVSTWPLEKLLSQMPMSSGTLLLLGSRTCGGGGVVDTVLKNELVGVNDLLHPVVCLWHGSLVDDRWCRFTGHHLGRVGAIHVAARAGRADMIAHLVGCGADVNLRNERGRTPLSLAASKGHMDAVRALVDAGADVDVKLGVGSKESTAATAASIAGHVEVTEYLLSRMSVTEEGSPATPTMDVAASQVLSPQSRRRRSLRMAVLQSRALDAMQAGEGGAVRGEAAAGTMEVEDAELLVSLTSGDPYDWDVEAIMGVVSKGGSGGVETAVLLGAATVGGFGLTASVMKAADVEVDTLMESSVCLWHSGGRVPEPSCRFVSHSIGSLTPLMAASRSGSTSAVRSLLDCGARCNIRNEHGVTALALASSKGHVEVVSLLLDAGADVHVRSLDGQSVTQAAVWSGHDEVAGMLSAAGGTFEVPESVAGSEAGGVLEVEAPAPLATGGLLAPPLATGGADGSPLALDESRSPPGSPSPPSTPSPPQSPLPPPSPSPPPSSSPPPSPTPAKSPPRKPAVQPASPPAPAQPGPPPPPSRDPSPPASLLSSSASTNSPPPPPFSPPPPSITSSVQDEPSRAFPLLRTGVRFTRLERARAEFSATPVSAAGSTPMARHAAKSALSQGPPPSPGSRSMGASPRRRVPAGRLPPVVWNLPGPQAVATSTRSLPPTDTWEWGQPGWSPLHADRTPRRSVTPQSPAVSPSPSVGSLTLAERLQALVPVPGEASPRAQRLLAKINKAAEVLQTFVDAEAEAADAVEVVRLAEANARVEASTSCNLAAWHTTQRAVAHNFAMDKLKLASETSHSPTAAIAYLKGARELCAGEEAVDDATLYRAKEKVKWDTDLAVAEESRLLEEERTSYARQDTMRTVYRTLIVRRQEAEQRFEAAVAARIRAEGEVETAELALRDRDVVPPEVLVEYVPPPPPQPRDRLGLRYHSTFFDRDHHVGLKFNSTQRVPSKLKGKRGRRRRR